MQVCTLPLSRITPYARNPRKNAAAVAKVKASLQEFGWQQPIVVDCDHVIVAGHTRYLAALELGWRDAPVHIATELTPAQAKAYRLADNRTGAEAEWDFDLLKLELEDLSGLDIDLDVLGFEEQELRQIADFGLNSGLEGEDEAPQLQEQAVSRPGDLWTLGKHRVLCGDATSQEDVHRLLEGVQPLLMVTDPPYGVEYDADWRNRLALGWAKSQSIALVQHDDQINWSAAYTLFPGDVVYLWHPAGANSVDFYHSLVDCGFEVRMQIIWAKPHFPIGRGHYHVQHEPCWYAVRKGQTAHWSGDRKQTTVWQIANSSAFKKSTDEADAHRTGHSTQKPVECMRRPMLNNSSPGQAVYDPFLGSGTSIIAAETCNRVAYGLEIEPRYVDMIVRRWQQFTSKQAVRHDGVKFDDLSASSEAAPLAAGV